MPPAELKTRLVFALATLVALWALGTHLSLPAGSGAPGAWVPWAISLAAVAAGLEAFGIRRLARSLPARLALSVLIGAACLVTLGR